MKPAILVYVVTYNYDVLCVCASRSIARAYCKQCVVDLDFHVDKFNIIEQPLLKKLIKL